LKTCKQKKQLQQALWQSNWIIAHIIQVGNIYVGPSFSTSITLNLKVKSKCFGIDILRIFQHLLLQNECEQ